MSQKSFTVTVYRVNEGEHQASEVTVEALGVNVTSEGDVQIETEAGGGHYYPATAWGKIEIVRVKDR